MRRIIRIVFVIIVLLLIAIGIVFYNKNENKESSKISTSITNKDIKKDASEENYDISLHPEDWRINDINTYKFFLHEIFDQFNNNVLNEKLWVSDEFRKNYSIDNIGIYLSIGEKNDEEWYRVDINTGDNTSLIDNTQEDLYNGIITLYTEKHINGTIENEIKYTLSFSIDSNNKLESIKILSKIINNDYATIRNNNSMIIESILNEVNSKKNVSINSFIIGDEFDINKLIFIDGDQKLIEVKASPLNSTNDKLLYKTKISENGTIKYFAFAVILKISDNSIIDAYIDFNSTWGELTEEQYNELK